MNPRILPTHQKRQFLPIIQRILLFAVAISLLISCVRLVWRAWTIEELLELEQQKLNNLETQKFQLQEKIETATSSFELERRAREELLLQASDEAVWQKEMN